MKNFNQELKNLLKTLDKFTDNAGKLLKQNIRHSAEMFDRELIQLLFENQTIRQHFFKAVGKAQVFDYRTFIDYIEDKKFLLDSYTKFSNKVGLTVSNKHLKAIDKVVLDFPFKDCILEGGQSKDDEKRKEIFFNEVLAKDEISRLLDKKVICNAKKYSQDGISDEVIFKRDDYGTIKDNLIIKGNNLLALHSLKSNFAGKVKLIYIDPPYNTGNDSFNYNDNFNHSTWLVFMKNRLEVARDLLSDDGVIFVQCDDNEQAYLKVLMDEVFGRGNFISNSAVVINRGGKDYGGIAKTHEYLLIYSIGIKELNFIEEKNKKFSHADDIGGFNLMELRNRNILFHDKNRPNLCYPFYINPSNEDDSGLLEVSLENQDNFIKLMPLKSQGVQTVWRWGKDKVLENINIDIKGKKKQDGGYMIVQKYRKTTKRQRSIWDEKEFVNERGTEHIKALFNNKKFAYPKSEFLLSKIIELSTQKGDLVLDYHLGSGTTAAVAHKMGRQYIGIEQMDYIEDIAVKRMQKVIGKKVQKDDQLLESVDFDTGGISKSVSWQGDGEFIYCELDKYNQAYIDNLNAIKAGHGTAKTIEQLFDEIAEQSFLNYDVDSKKLSTNKADFKSLNLNNQLKFLFSILNKNQLYKNLSEIDDRDLGVNDKTKALNKDFYGDNQ